MIGCLFLGDEEEEEEGGDYDEMNYEAKGAEAAQPYSPGVGYPQQVGYQPPPMNYSAPPPDYNGATQNLNSSVQFNDPNISRSSAADTFV